MLIRRTRHVPYAAKDLLLPDQARRSRAPGDLWPRSIVPDNPYSPGTTSVLFDGVAAFPGESVDFGNFTEVDHERTDAFTWNLWMKHSGAGALNDAIFSKASFVNFIASPTLDGNWRWTVRSSLQDLHITSDVGANAPKVNDGEWHMITGVCRGNASLTPADLDMYQNAVELTVANSTRVNTAVGPVTDTISTVAALLLANQAGQLINFGGNICHVSVHNFAMNQAQVTELYGLRRPQDLITMSYDVPGWWCAVGNGDGLGASAFIDLSGNGNHGTQTDLEIGDFVLDFPS